MTENQSIHYQYQTAINVSEQTQTMVFLHGLFGDLNNLGGIARSFADSYHILKVDLRNHGQSFHSNEMNYQVMAEDVKALLEQLNIQNAIIVGHSMGGKTAMKVADLAANLIDKVVVIDIAPVRYPLNRHDNAFAGLFAVKDDQSLNRQQAKTSMSKFIRDEGVQQFMLKSFDAQSSQRFKFNLSALKENYPNIMDWQEVFVDKPTLFIKGELSDYLKDKDTEKVLAQFPKAKLFVVSNTDHWVHAEKPEAVVRAIQKFLGHQV